MYTRLTFLFIIITAFASSCEGTEKHFLNGIQVFTENNIPVPNALVYVEIWNNNKPVNFTFGVTGPDGKIPSEPPIPIPMSKWAKASYVAFADGYSSTIISNAIVEGKYQQSTIKLGKDASIDVTKPGSLAFPFDEYPRLQNKLRNPVFRTLLVHWLNEFGYIFSKKDALPLYLQNRLPQMEKTIGKLNIFFDIK